MSKFFYATDLESDGLFETATKIWCFGAKPIGHEGIYVFCEYDELDPDKKEDFISRGVKFFKLEQFFDLMKSKKTKGVSWHNCQKFDFKLIKKLYNFEYDWRSFDGRELVIEDTLCNSQYLNPIRQLPKGCPTSILNIETNRKEKIGPHSLEAWGWRTGFKKLGVYDWRTQPLDVYVERVISDCYIQEATHFAQEKEILDVAISSGRTPGNWKNPLRMGIKNFFLIGEQESNGALFDQDLGWKLLDDLDTEMKELEDELNPLFGERVLPKSDQIKFNKDNAFRKCFDYEKPFKKTGGLKKQVTDYLSLIGIQEDKMEEYISGMCEEVKEDGHVTYKNNIEEMIPKHPDYLTQAAINYCEKLGITDKEKQFQEIIRLLDGGEIPVQTAPTGLRDVQAVKEFLVKEGWRPTLWNFRNITTDPKTKKKLSKEKQEQKLTEYIEEFRDHVYWPFILLELGYSKDSKVNPDSKSFRTKCFKNSRNLLSSPVYKDQNGIRCPNLKELTGDTSKKIIRFLSLKHRRSMLKSTDPKKKDTHGLLNNPRLKVDGRISAGITGLAASTRKRHFGIVNIPKVGSVYGKEMRSLFIAPEGWWNIGADACSIEALVASHWTIPFDGGIYAQNVLTGKFHDNNAETYSEIAQRIITRSSGKNISYALLYGASAKKIARMMSIPLSVAEKVVEQFWETNTGLKGIRDAITEYWKKTDKKYIIGLDGRKLFSRSQHSLINLLFQSTGAILLDFVLCYWYDKCKEEELIVQRWTEQHDEIEFYNKEEEVQIFTFPASKEEELPLKDGKPNRKEDPLKPKQEREGKQYSVPKFIDGEWHQAYSRAGEIVNDGFKVASKYYKTNVEFTSEYMWGKNWASCH